MDATLAIVAFIVLGLIIWRVKIANEINYSFIESYEFSDVVRQAVSKRYSHLTDSEVDSVLAGLKQFFVVCGYSNLCWCTMPSKVVDEAWHQLILNTREYESFCQGAFGRMLHHTPATPMKNQKSAQLGIQRAWRSACRAEALDPRGPNKIPLLFALDSSLKIADGHYYVLNCDMPAFKGKENVYCAGHIDSAAGGGGISCGGGGD